MPGGPIRVRIAPRLLVHLDPALGAQLAHGDVLRDAVLDVLQARVVGVEHLTRVDRVEDLVGALAPRHGDEPVEVRADHRRLLALLARALEAVELALGLLAHVVGHAGVGDLRAVLVGDRLVLAQLAADRVHLLAQEVLALLLLGAGLDVVADAVAHLQLGQPLALELDGEREALGDVDGLQQADLLLERQVGAVAGRVGQRAGLGDGAQERRDALVGAALGEDLLHDRAVLALELAGAPVDGLGVGMLGDLGAQPAVGSASAAPAMTPRASLSSETPRPPPGRRIVSATLAIVPTLAYCPSCRGTSRTRSSPEASTGRLMSIVGKMTVSSRGMSSSLAMRRSRFFRCTHNYTEHAYET